MSVCCGSIDIKMIILEFNDKNEKIGRLLTNPREIFAELEQTWDKKVSGFTVKREKTFKLSL